MANLNFYDTSVSVPQKLYSIRICYLLSVAINRIKPVDKKGYQYYESLVW